MSDPVLQLFHRAEETILLKEANTKLQERLLTVNQELTHVRCLLDCVLKTIAQGILFIDLYGTIVTINEAAARFLNVQPQEVLHQSFWNRFADDFLGFSLREALRFALAQRLLYKTIESKELEISTTFHFEGARSSHGLIIFLRDITEIQRLHQLTNNHDRMKELGEMAAIVAHEIRNPLGGIRGYAALLHRDLAQQKHLQEMAGFVIEGTKSLESLVTTVLQFARPIQLQIQSIELGAFLKKLSQFVRIDPAFPPHVRFEIHIPQEPLLAPIDPDALKSCLLNLIYNAFQAMPLGGTLTLSLLKQELTCLISVSDTGIGIEPTHLQKLFSPFFTTKQKGTGLGLVEAQKIVRAHSGQLDVRSLLNRGTTFTLTLPLKR